MKRKIVLHGLSTLTISLPSHWVKRFGVQRGDELNVEEHGRELRVNFQEKPCSEKKHIKVGILERTGESEITSSYRQGYDEIYLEYDNAQYIETIQEIISKEIIGFEIIKQGKNYCLIKDLAGHNRDEFDVALRRAWLLALDLARESLEAFAAHDSARLKNIMFMDYSINKFTNYCLRLLTKYGHSDFKKTPLYYHVIKRLEEIADQYKDLCGLYQNNNGKTNKELILVFTEVNGYFNCLYELFYKYDKQRIEELFKKTKLTYNKLSNSKDRTNLYLAFICKDIRNLFSVLVEENL